MTVIPIIIGAHRTFPGLKKKTAVIGKIGKIEAVQTTALLKLTRILRRVLET